MLRSQHGTSVVVEEHVSSQRFLNNISVGIFHWGLSLLVFTFLAFVGCIGFGWFGIRCVKVGETFLGNFIRGSLTRGRFFIGLFSFVLGPITWFVLSCKFKVRKKFLVFA